MLHHPIFLKENPCCTWITRFPLVAAKTVNTLKTFGQIRKSTVKTRIFNNIQIYTTWYVCVGKLACSNITTRVHRRYMHRSQSFCEVVKTMFTCWRLKCNCQLISPWIWNRHIACVRKAVNCGAAEHNVTRVGTSHRWANDHGDRL